MRLMKRRRFQDKIKSVKKWFLGAAIIVFFSGLLFSQNTPDPASALSGMAQLRDYISKRISSYDQSGINVDRIGIGSGKTAILADIAGTGIIRHIWVTIACSDPMIRRNAILRMYWDGETEPSVESPIGDFFGNGWGENYNFISLPLAAAPKEGRGMNSYFPMPFGNGARITLENQSADTKGDVYPAVVIIFQRYESVWRKYREKPLSQNYHQQNNTDN